MFHDPPRADGQLMHRRCAEWNETQTLKIYRPLPLSVSFSRLTAG